MNKIYIFLALFIIVSPIKLIPNQFLLSNSEINRSEIVLSTPPARIKVQSPDGGEIWYAGTSNTIKWDDNIIEDVVIELYKGGICLTVPCVFRYSKGLPYKSFLPGM